MRILIVHNEYGAISGEEVMLNHVAGLFASRGHTVERYTRTSQEIDAKIFGKTRALVTGVYSARACEDIRALLGEFKPDVVIVKNLFPLISAAILPIISAAGVPIMMLVSNYRLICPNGLHYAHGQVCERCVGGREYQCILRNCESNLAKSFGYALRSWVARKAGWYRDYVSAFICASNFLRHRLIQAGYEPSTIHVVPNYVPDPTGGVAGQTAAQGHFVGYAGRISKEKGIPTLLRAAALCPEIEFRLAGRVNVSKYFLDIAPKNATFVGFLQGKPLVEFVQNARLVVSASECFETFGMSVAEAMLCSRPVVVSRIGVFPEFVRENETGILFDPGNPADLAEKIRYLWNRPELCTSLGARGREHASAVYSESYCYAGLMRAIESITDASSPV